MKPALSRPTLQVALVIVGAMLVAIGEAPGLDTLIPTSILHLMAVAGAALGSSQLIRRLGDYAPDELPQEWVEAVERVNAQGQPEAK